MASKVSTVYLSEAALKNNITFLQKKIGAKIKISAVVKANAYGHGIEQTVPMLCKSGINHFAVFDFDEAKRVAGCMNNESAVMIMGWISDPDIIEAIEKGFEFYVFDLTRLFLAIEKAKELNMKAKIHLEVETGMNRSGLHAEAFKQALHLIEENSESIEFIGLCTHLAGAESISNFVRIQKQLKSFQRFEKILEGFVTKPIYRHAANSAASFVYPKARMNMVRIGIMQYGFWSSTETFMNYVNNKTKKTDPLMPILSWKSKVMVTKHVKAGEYIGYGISYLAQYDTVTALIPIGYAMGYSRSLSNRGTVLVAGQICNIIGVVNMNMIIADISKIPDIEPGEEVVIIGKQANSEIKVSSFGEAGNKLNYEVLAHLSGNIQRVVV